MKSKWLDGKRNRCVDYLLHTLITGLLPDTEDRLKQQGIGKHGGDLEVTRRGEILACAPQVLQEAIEQINEENFLVRSSKEEKNILLILH